jgi:sugar phosphate isomerase/epimerase
MTTIKGPAIFLAQFAGDEAPFNSLDSMAQWAASLGYKAVQIPTWDPRLIDMEKASSSQAYCDDLKATVARHGLEISDLASHLAGQLVAVNPAYDTAFAAFGPPEIAGKPTERYEWAKNQLGMTAKACRRLGLTAAAAFSGGYAWPYVYPWPQRAAGLVEKAFEELAKLWVPILDLFDEQGVDCCYEIMAGEDLHDGVSFERFLELTDNHPRCKMLYDPSHLIMQGIDYLGYIDNYHEFFSMFHVKDAEVNLTSKSGFYGGFENWLKRPGRTRSLGDGQVDFKGIFSKMAEYDYNGWAVLEWECVLKHPEDGAREGAEFIRDHIIRVTDKAFDDFAGSKTDDKILNSMLGLD